MKGPTTAQRLQATGVLAVMMLTATVALAAMAQEQPLPPLAEGEIGPGATQSFTVNLSAGDITIGTFQLTDISGSFVVLDQRGHTLSKFTLDNPGRMRVGFLAPISGAHRVQVISRGSRSGSYSLQLRTRGPAAAAKVPVTPINRYSSARINQLATDLRAGRPGALSRFWDEAVAAKGVFIEPVAGDDQTMLATFLWRELYETHNVKLIRPPESATSMDYYLSRVPGTDVWHKTMKLHRTTRFEYRFAPNHVPDEDVVGADPYVPYAVADPLNPNLFPADIDHSDWTPGSILALPGAPDDRWATLTPSRRGSVVERTFDSRLLNARLHLSIYTPPGYAAERGPYALVVLFDGPAYNSDIVAAPTTLDNLIAAEKIRPPVVCFVSSVSSTADVPPIFSSTPHSPTPLLSSSCRGCAAHLWSAPIRLIVLSAASALVRIRACLSPCVIRTYSAASSRKTASEVLDAACHRCSLMRRKHRFGSTWSKACTTFRTYRRTSWRS